MATRRPAAAPNDEYRGEPADGQAGERRIRVCHLAVRPYLHGAQRSVLDLCRHLNPERFAPSVICAGEGPLTEALRLDGIPYHLAPALVSPIRPHKDLLALARVVRILRREGFDLVHTHTSKGGFIGRIAARMAGVPRVVHHVHGYAFHDESRFYEHRLYTFLESLANRLADRIIFVNHEERRMSVEQGLVRPAKATTIYNGVDLERFGPARNRDARRRFRRTHCLADDELAILVCGRIERQKQPLIVPRIAAALEALDRSARWRILIAGSGSYEDQLRTAILRHRMGHRVEVLGWCTDTGDVTCGSDIALLPSLWEGLPRVLLEAHAEALPSVASNIKGNREVVTDATGILCRPKDPADYARALHRLIGDETARERMGRAALERARGHFCLRRQCDQVVAIYEALFPQRRRGAES